MSGLGAEDVRDWLNQVHIGDCRKLMRQMIADKVQVQTIVTSPPYWNLRDYGHKGQMGSEPTLQAWVRRMRDVFRLAWDVLKDDGTLWLNLGDSYNAHPGQRKTTDKAGNTQTTNRGSLGAPSRNVAGLAAKQLLGMPWRVAFALQDDGWILRSDIIWSKPNPMPESVTDRPTKAHEYIFILSKSSTYFYDFEAVKEPSSDKTHERRPLKPVTGHDHGPGAHSTLNHAMKQDGPGRRHAKFNDRWNETQAGRIKNNASFDAAMAVMPEDRNMRTVWTFPTEAFKGAHFATFPRALVERCVLAGSRPGDVVLDIFMGSGTVAEVAAGLGRNYIGLEINPSYVEMFRKYRSTQLGMAL
jgi:site-specific DNA-methyltransferase (cytosine-N4-specific)